MNEASQARHDQIESLLSFSPIGTVANDILRLLLEESVVQAQRIEMLEKALAKRGKAS